MADDFGQGGVAADVVQQAAARVGDAGQWLDAREPGQVVHEVQSFARRRPAAFLLLAAGAGLVAGRLTRGIDARPVDIAIDRCPPRRTPAGDRWRASHVCVERQRRHRRHRPSHAPRLDRADDAVERLSLSTELLASTGRAGRRSPHRSLDLHSAGITSIVWATGFRRQYDWVELPILDRAARSRSTASHRCPAHMCSASFQHYRSSLHRRRGPRRSPSPSTSRRRRPAAAAHSLIHPDTRDRHVPAPHQHRAPERHRLRRDRRRRPPPAPPLPCCSPSGRVLAVERRARRRHALHPCNHAVSCSCPGGACSTRSSPPARRR